MRDAVDRRAAMEIAAQAALARIAPLSSASVGRIARDRFCGMVFAQRTAEMDRRALAKLRLPAHARLVFEAANLTVPARES